MIPKSQMVVTSGVGGGDGGHGGELPRVLQSLVPCLVVVHVLTCIFLCEIYLLQLKKKNMVENQKYLRVSVNK